MARHRTSTDPDRVDWAQVDLDPVDRLDLLRPPAPQLSGWVPERGSSGRSADDWDDTRWSPDDLLIFGAPDRDPPVPVDVADELSVAGTKIPGKASGRSVGTRAGDDADAGTDTDTGPADDANADHDDDDGVDLESGVDRDPEPEPVRSRKIRAGPWGRRLAETWVPETLRDARVDPGRKGALILSLIAALAAVAAAIGVWRDRPEPRPVQPVALAPVTDAVSPARSGAPIRSGAVRAPGSSDANSSASPPAVHSTESVGATGPAVIAVSVTGLVRSPGLIRLPTGARVADAIAAAGGVTLQGSITGLNLAATLTDGDSVVVGAASTAPPIGRAPGSAGAGPGLAPQERSAGGAAAGGTPAAPINLNTADAADLETLPGVGPVMAANIIGWREQNGSFSSIQQLQEVTGIGPARYAQLAPLVVVA